MFPTLSQRGQVADEARIARAKRQFEMSQEQYPRDEAVLKTAGQQHGLYKLEGGWSPTLPRLDTELITQIRLDLMREQMRPRIAFGNLPTPDFEIPSREEREARGEFGEAIAQAQQGLRTPFGAVMGTDARGDIVPTDARTKRAPASFITPNPKLEPSLLPF